MRHLDGLGWRRDRPDPRDRRLSLAPSMGSTVYDLRNQFMPDPYAQLKESSCVGNSVAGLVSYVHDKEGKGKFDASRNFIYYQARLIEGSQDIDAGAEIRDAMRACATVGVCSEETAPYDPANVNTGPTANQLAEAAQHKILRYMRVPQDIRQIKSVLAAGYPFVFGFTCFESFESDQVAATGILPMPKPGEDDIGGHAVMGCAHDDIGQIAPRANFTLIRNSWGPDWGLKGYFWMPDEYLLDSNLCSDFWTIRLED